jgi:serine O-acetyltransferase
MKNKFSYEFWKFTGNEYKHNLKCLIRVYSSHTLHYLFYGRKQEVSKIKLIRKYYDIRKKIIGNKSGIEIPTFENIGFGLLLCHVYCITINEDAILGDDVTLFKGTTIGRVRTGKRAGVPTIGNRVVICSNATVCGNVIIGDDIMIAPGAFVNFDVPSDSVVVGNPGIIHHKKFAADDYFTTFADREHYRSKENVTEYEVTLNK